MFRLSAVTTAENKLKHKILVQLKTEHVVGLHVL